MALSLARLALPISPELSAALEDFDCVGGAHEGDDVAANVCDFLRSHRYRAGIEHGFSATYLYINPDVEPQIVGYVTLTLDAVRLTNAEKIVRNRSERERKSSEERTVSMRLDLAPPSTPAPAAALAA